jgi:heme oxygenase (biliverdin-IX-beta and delta-forming)
MMPKPAHEALRAGTRAGHDRVDAAFGGFDLGDRDSYRRFLCAHAAALLPIEAWLDTNDATALISDWPGRRRAATLTADLGNLGAEPAPAPPFDCDTHPAMMAGVIYVVEGSRLGGRLLSRRIGPDLPSAYLDADQPAGNWQFLLSQLDTILYDDALRALAVQGALRAFDRFERAGLDWLAKERV